MSGYPPNTIVEVIPLTTSPIVWRAGFDHVGHGFDVRHPARSLCNRVAPAAWLELEEQLRCVACAQVAAGEQEPVGVVRLPPALAATYRVVAEGRATTPVPLARELGIEVGAARSRLARLRDLGVVEPGVEHRSPQKGGGRWATGGQPLADPCTCVRLTYDAR